MNRLSYGLMLAVFFSFIASCKYNDSPSPYVKVYKSDGSTQCNSDGIALDVTILELTNAGIDVVCSETGNDGLVRTAECGQSTGNLNVYKINKVNLVDAQKLGFDPISNLGNYHSYQECK
jgi:hypothetical protein